MLISSFIPFPSVSWWLRAAPQADVLLDAAEHYQKMSYRNRYYLAGSQGRMLLSIPLQSGRNQRKEMREVMIDNKVRWQENHWRTIVSNYRRSPYFEYFEHLLQPLYSNHFDSLMQWCYESILLMDRLCDLQLSIKITNEYCPEYGRKHDDIRTDYLPKDNHYQQPAVYHQVFGDKTGFIADCSLLDLLFCEGRAAKSIILRT